MKENGRKITVILLVAAMIFAGIFGFLWHRERTTHADLEQLCTSAAYAARDRFADFRSDGSDFSYDYAVAELVSFFNSYLLLCVETEGSSHPNCVYINSLIGDLMADPAAGKEVIAELVELMDMLATDIYDDNAYHLAFSLHNQLSR